MAEYGGETGHVDKLGERLQDPDFRRRFAADHQKALEEEGITDLPSGLLETLSDCGEDELRTLATMGKKWRDAGLDPLDIRKIV